MLRSAVILTALVFPGVAFAQCPTKDDLYQGINMTFDTADTESYYTGRGNVIVNEGSDNLIDSAANWTIQLASGVFETYVHERIAGKWRPTAAFSLDYDFDYATAFPLTAGDVGGGVQNLVDEGGVSEPATYSYSVHAAADIIIGDCSYATLDVYQTYLLPDGGFGLSRMIYLKDVGFGYIVESFWSNGKTLSRVATGIAVDG